MTAGDFLKARSSHLSIEALPSSNGFDLDAAYAIESEIKRLREAEGAVVAGRKVGYANRAMWRILKLDTLVWAHMFEDTVHMAPKGIFELPITQYRSPKLEPEIVIKVKDPGAGDGLAATEWIALGFEILDNPYPDWKFQPVDFVAAWGLHVALIVGKKLEVTASNIETLTSQLGDFKLLLLRNNVLVEEGSGKNSLRSPALCLTELAHASAHRNDPLRPGEIISTGTLTDAQTILPGEEWRAEPNGLPLESLSLQFK
jgi:2-oxo-3-hexenedioate decarboxylase